MNFYHSTHHHYCGIDLHARSLYVCIIDQQGEALLHKEIKAQPELLLATLEPFRDDLVVGVECMHCWYWFYAYPKFWKRARHVHFPGQ